MPDTKSYVVYQAYGITDVLNEVLVSIASLYEASDDATRPTVVVYTDSEDYLKKFLPEDVCFIPIHKEQWGIWKGEMQFVHRAKIEMLRHFCQSHRGNVLYSDTDTYFLTDPKPLFDLIERAVYIMHVDEGKLDGTVNKVFQKLEKFLKNYQYKGIRIPVSTHMWNAGILGFHTSERNVLDDVLALADDLYAAYPKHVMEQLAFSYYFSKRERVSCDDFIYHYWDFKEYRKTLAVFFQNNADVPFLQWQNKLNGLLPMELIKQKQAFMSKPYWVRKALTWMGKGYYR